MARQRAGRRERRAGGRGGHHPASRDIDDADYEWYRYLGEGRGGAPSGPDRRAPASSEPPRTGPGRLAGGTAGRRAADEQSRPLYPSWDDDYARPLYPAQDLAAPPRPASAPRPAGPPRPAGLQPLADPPPPPPGRRRPPARPPPRAPRASRPGPPPPGGPPSRGGGGAGGRGRVVS